MTATCNDQLTAENGLVTQTSNFLDEINVETAISKLNAPPSPEAEVLINKRSPASYSEMMSARRSHNAESNDATVSQQNYYGNTSTSYDLNGVYSTTAPLSSSKENNSYPYYDYGDSATPQPESNYINHEDQFDYLSSPYDDIHGRNSINHPNSPNMYNGQYHQGSHNRIPSARRHPRHGSNMRFNQSHMQGLNSARSQRSGGLRRSGYGGAGRSPALSSPISVTSDADSIGNSIGNSNVIELLVTNLDFNIGSKEWKKILFMQFNSVIKTLQQVYMQTQQDGSSAAVVRVQSIEEARLLISHFHRKKIGYKRIQVNLLSPHTHNGGVSPQSKQEVVALLRSVTGGSLPVCKFMELFEKRYHRSISISDLYKMRDVVEIKEFNGNQSGRVIELIGGPFSTEITSDCDNQEMDGLLESPVCSTHCIDGTQDYIEAMDLCFLPNVVIALKTFKQHVHKLLQQHNGVMPLMSFPSCYKAEFGLLNLVRDHGIGGAGVPLEHLITCVTGVRVIVSTSGVKKIQWEERKDDGSSWSSATSTPRNIGGVNNGTAPSSTLGDQMHQFSREVVDLIKHQPGCKILLSKFIPAYHHHFGKQCRVADYGFSKLHELVEALPHVVHVVGIGNLRVLTLAHKVQVRRFTNELTKILKSTPNKASRLVDIPHYYLRILGRSFDMTDYGVCFIEDMLEEIPENTIEITSQGNDILLSLPRRIQTIEEKEKTAQFALEVVDLLKQSPRCRLPFTKFIPSYHHHFSRQCRVSDYGFNKLVELLEAVPQVVKSLPKKIGDQMDYVGVIEIVEEFGEKYVSLTRREHLRVMAEQTLALLESAPKKRIQLRDFITVYMKHQGHALNLEDFGVRSVRQLLQKMPRIVKLEYVNNEEFVSLADRADIRLLAHKVLLVLLDLPCGSLSEAHFCEKYRCMYREEPDLALIRGELTEIVHLAEDPAQPGAYRVKLRPLILFARDLRDLLRLNQGKLPLACFESSYEKQHGEVLRPQAYGYPSTNTLLQAVDFVAVVRGRGVRSTILLCQEFLGKLSYKVAYSTEPLMDASDMEDERQNQQDYQPMPLEQPPMQAYYYPQQYHMNVYDGSSQMHLQQMPMGPTSPGNYLLPGPQMGPPPPPPPPPPLSTQRPLMTAGDLAAVQQHASMFYAANQHDQRQLDELVERLAYESSPSPAPGVLPAVTSAPMMGPAGLAGPAGFEYASPPPYVSHPPYHMTPPPPPPPASFYPPSHPQQAPNYWYEPVPTAPPPPQQPGICPVLPYGALQQPPTQPPMMHLGQQRMQPLMPVVTSSHLAVQPLLSASANGENNQRKSPTVQKELNDSMCSLEDSTPVKQMMVAMGMKAEVDKSGYVDVNNNVPTTTASNLMPPNFEDPISPSGSSGAKSDKSSLSTIANSGAVYKLNAVNLPATVFSQDGSVKTEVSENSVTPTEVGSIIAELKLESNGDNENLNNGASSANQVKDRPTFSSLRTN